MTQQTKTYLVAGLGIIIILGFGWRVSTRDQSSREMGTAKIAIMTPLSGDFAALGTSIKNGIELAKEDLLSKGVINNIEIIYENDQCVPKDGLSAIQKLIQVEQIRIIGGFFCVNVLEAVAPTTEQNKIVVFNIAANTASLLDKEYVFSTNFSIKDDSQKITDFVFQELGARKAAIVFIATPFGEDYSKFLEERFEALGGKIIANERTELGEVDYRSQITKIKSQNPDVVYVIQLAGSLGNFLKQAAELNLNTAIVGHYEAEDPTVINTAGAAAEGFIISSSEPAKESKVASDFREAYEQKYGDEPDVLASNAYDSLHLQVLAFKKCGNDTDCIKKELHSVRNYEGASGLITINNDGSASKPTIFKVVLNGDFVSYDPAN